MTPILTHGRISVGNRILALARPLLAALLLGVALVLLWQATAQAALLLSYPYPTDTLEGTLLHEARLLRAGEPLYQPLELYRFVSAPYPPLHPILLAQVDRLVGPHIFWSGRLISLGAALVVGLLTLLLVRVLSGSWSAAALATTILLSAPPFYLWATRIKPDLLALMWTTLGLTLATWARIGTTSALPPSPPAPLPPGERGVRAAGSTKSTLRLVAAALCFGLAFLTKQTAVAAPLATGVALLIDDLLAWYRFRHLSSQTLIFAVTYLALALGTWALLDLVYSGQYTVHVWWSGNRVRWWSLGLLLKVTGLLLPYWPLLLLGAVAAIIGLGQRTSRTLACYALVAPLTLSATGEIGANHNHLLETLLASSLCAGTLVGWQITRQMPDAGDSAGRARLLGRYVVLTALLTAQVWLIFHPPAWYGSELDPALRDNPERFVTFMRATPGEILADDPGLLLMAGKPIRYDDASTMGSAATIGTWDQRGMLDDIANHRFSAIMIPVDVRKDTIDPSGRWSPEMIAAITHAYKRLYKDQIVTYVPR
ncbi:MAG: phospholipid carrier-dependent glycosyltransferase [Chloroflexales bacterium]